ADVFLLNDRAPSLLPNPGSVFTQGGLTLAKSEAAPTQLLRDLSGDRGMKWLPRSGMWLDYIKVHSSQQALSYDLAIDPSGANDPSPVDAGLAVPGTPAPASSIPWALWVGVAVLGLAAVVAGAQRRRMRAAPCGGAS